MEALGNRARVGVVRPKLLLAQPLLLQEAGSPPQVPWRTWTPTSTARGAWAWTRRIQVFCVASAGSVSAREGRVSIQDPPWCDKCQKGG